MDRGLQRQPSALRAEDALAPRVHRGTNRNRLIFRRNGGRTKRFDQLGPHCEGDKQAKLWKQFFRLAHITVTMREPRAAAVVVVRCIGLAVDIGPGCPVLPSDRELFCT